MAPFFKPMRAIHIPSAQKNCSTALRTWMRSYLINASSAVINWWTVSQPLPRHTLQVSTQNFLYCLSHLRITKEMSWSMWDTANSLTNTQPSITPKDLRNLWDKDSMSENGHAFTWWNAPRGRMWRRQALMGPNHHLPDGIQIVYKTIYRQLSLLGGGDHFVPPDLEKGY